MSKTVYLTIDDSPSVDFAEKVEFLRARQIPAVFFCRGDYLEQQVLAAVRALQQGFIIANHSYDHPHFSAISVAECEAQIRRTDAIIQTVYEQAGFAWRQKYFRFPYGDQGDLKYGHLLRPYAAISGQLAGRSARLRQQLVAFIRPAQHAVRLAEQERVGQARKRQIQHCLAELGYTFPDFSATVNYSYLRDFVDHDWPWTFDALEWATTQRRPPANIRGLTEVLARLHQPNPPDLRGNVPEPAYGLPFAGSADILLLHDHAETTALFYPIIDRLVANGVVFGSF